MFKALVVCACTAVLAISTGSTSQQHKMTKQDASVEKEIRQIESDIFCGHPAKRPPKLAAILADDFRL
jgi:hypothetical protein